MKLSVDICTNHSTNAMAKIHTISDLRLCLFGLLQANHALPLHRRLPPNRWAMWQSSRRSGCPVGFLIWLKVSKSPLRKDDGLWGWTEGTVATRNPGRKNAEFLLGSDADEKGLRGCVEQLGRFCSNRQPKEMPLGPPFSLGQGGVAGGGWMLICRAVIPVSLRKRR